MTPIVLPFVHPGLAGAALLAALAPIIIHLISRRRHARTPWAAMAFLLAANRRSARRMRFEHWMLMLLRIAVILLLGAAVARPFLPASGVLPSSFTRAHRVLVLDNSLSMSAKEIGDRTRFLAAKDAALHLVGSFPPDDAVSLVTLASPAEAVIAHAAFDRRWSREAVAAVESTQRTTDVVGGVEAVRKILRDSPAAAGNRMIYLISDFAATDWHSISPLQPGAAARAVHDLALETGGSGEAVFLVRVETDAQDNVAVTKLEPETALIGVDVPIRLLIEVTNHGASTLRDVLLQVRRDGIILRREALPTLGPGATATAVVTTEFPSAGVHAIDARIASPTGNALSEDDVRFLSLEAVDQRPILLVDGRPGARTLEGRAGFLAVALAPGLNGTTHGGLDRAKTGYVFAPTVIAETEFDAQVLDRFDAVALADVPRLSPADWTRLEHYVAEGGGLFIALGDLVSADGYNRFGHAEGKGLLPGRLGRVVEFQQGDDASPWKLDAQPHAVVADFAGEPNSGLFRARVDHYLTLEPDLRRAEVVLRFADESPALVASKFGRGNVLTWTTSANMNWTNLPAKGDFVALVHNVFSMIVPRRGLHRNVRVGESLREPLAPAETAMSHSVRTDDGVTHEPSLASDGDGLALVYGPVNRAQFVGLGVGGQFRAAAVNVDPAESNVTVTSTAELTASINAPVTILSDRTIGEEPPSAAKSTELGAFALYALIVLLLGELWMAMRFAAPADRSASRDDERSPAVSVYEAVSRP